MQHLFVEGRQPGLDSLLDQHEQEGAGDEDEHERQQGEPQHRDEGRAFRRCRLFAFMGLALVDRGRKQQRQRERRDRGEHPIGAQPAQAGRVDEGAEHPIGGQHADHEHALDQAGQAGVLARAIGNEPDHRIDDDLGNGKGRSDHREMQSRDIEALAERHDRARRECDDQRDDERIFQADARQIAGGGEGHDRDGDVLEAFERARLRLGHVEAGNRLEDHRADAVQQHRKGDIGQDQCGDQPGTGHGHRSPFCQKEGWPRRGRGHPRGGMDQNL